MALFMKRNSCLVYASGQYDKFIYHIMAETDTKMARTRWRAIPQQLSSCHAHKPLTCALTGPADKPAEQHMQRTSIGSYNGPRSYVYQLA